MDPSSAPPADPGAGSTGPAAATGSRRRRVPVFLLVLAALLPVALAGLLAIEGHDPACASCHLPPESQFVARSDAPPVDLASAHAQAEQGLPCIDCHAAPGVTGRLRALELAARDSWRFLAGDYVVVGQEYLPLGRSRHPIGDQACRACHLDSLEDPAFENHFHALLDDDEAPPGPHCAACHAAHRMHPESPWFDDSDLAPTCDACHLAMGGPSSVLGSAGDR